MHRLIRTRITHPPLVKELASQEPWKAGALNIEAKTRSCSLSKSRVKEIIPLDFQNIGAHHSNVMLNPNNNATDFYLNRLKSDGLQVNAASVDRKLDWVAWKQEGTGSEGRRKKDLQHRQKKRRLIDQFGERSLPINHHSLKATRKRLCSRPGKADIDESGVVRW